MESVICRREDLEFISTSYFDGPRRTAYLAQDALNRIENAPHIKTVVIDFGNSHINEKLSNALWRRTLNEPTEVPDETADQYGTPDNQADSIVLTTTVAEIVSDSVIVMLAKPSAAGIEIGHLYAVLHGDGPTTIVDPHDTSSTPPAVAEVERFSSVYTVAKVQGNLVIGDLHSRKKRHLLDNVQRGYRCMRIDEADVRRGYFLKGV